MAAHFHLWLCSKNVCLGSLADITACSSHVRFAPKSGHYVRKVPEADTAFVFGAKPLRQVLCQQAVIPFIGGAKNAVAAACRSSCAVIRSRRRRRAVCRPFASASISPQSFTWRRFAATRRERDWAASASASSSSAASSQSSSGSSSSDSIRVLKKLEGGSCLLSPLPDRPCRHGRRRRD